MTITIEVAPETEARLQQEASRRGVPIEHVAGEMLDDLLQDIEDAHEAQAILAGGDLSDCYTLNDLRRALGKPEKPEPEKSEGESEEPEQTARAAA